MSRVYALVSIAALSVGAIALAHAADPTVKDRVRVVWQAPRLPLSVSMEKALDVTMPAMPAEEGRMAVLRLQARLDCPANSGWNKFLGLEINGQPVYETVSGIRNGPQRVLNRDATWRPPGYENDYMLFRENRALVVFAPDFKQFDQRLAPEGEEAFWLVMNVGDLLRPDGPNTIRLSNAARPVWFEGQNHDIVIGDLSLGYLASSSGGAGTPTYRPLPKGSVAGGQGFSVTLCPSGGMAVRIGDEHYLIETSLTWPRGERNWLDTPGRPGSGKPQEWRVLKTELGSSSGMVVAQGEHYRLTRQLKLDGPRIQVSDTVLNRTDADLGLELAYSLSAGGPLPVLHLAGNPDPSLTYVDQCGDNPTVFAGQRCSGLGWAAEDDLLRAQLRLEVSQGVTRMKSINLGLAPRSSCTLEWTLYPLAGSGAGPSGPKPAGALAENADYWAFINQVRRDWGVNYRIDGPFHFIGHCSGISESTVEALRKRLAGRDVRLATMHPWTNYQYPYDRRQHKAWWQVAQEKVHEALPGAKCLLMMEPPLESRVLETKVDDDPYRDSMVVNPDGKVAFDLGYSPEYVTRPDFAAGWRLVWRYPTLTNSWGKYLEHDVEFAMDECRADGMYIDCFSYGAGRDWCRYTYDRWDGHTIDLDPTTHEITRKYADLSLLSAAACEHVVRLIQAEGGLVVANTEPTTRNMRKLRVNRFVETGDGSESACGTHLYTPVALGYPSYLRPTKTAADAQRLLMADVRADLSYGALYYYYGVPDGLRYGFINRMFPFTPRELHSGWLVGEERIITSKSGAFGWGDRSRARVYHYDSAGRESLLDIKPRVAKGANLYPVEVGEGEIVILERIHA